MANSAYTYEPENIKEFGKDRMRFELGDTMVEGGPDTSALTDQEIQAAIEAYPKSWKRAKLFLLESLCRLEEKEQEFESKLHLILQWKEVSAESCSVPKFANGVHNKPPYFYTGMQQNERARHR